MRGRPVVPVPKPKRGKGKGSEFVAYVQAGDGVSRGQRNRLFSHKLVREVICLSRGEKDVCLILERATVAIDFREQYPLYPIEETMAIAEQLGVKPCALNVQGKPMTTDFLVTCREGLTEKEVAISFKLSRELANPRTLELAEIERVFHQRRGTIWGVVTELDIPRTVVTNLDLLVDFYALEDLRPLTAADVASISAALLPRITNGNTPLNLAALEVDTLLNHEAGTCLPVAWHLIATRQIAVDLEKPLKPDEPLALLTQEP